MIHMKSTTIICFVLALCFQSYTSDAQKVWTLEECINRAMTESLRVKSSEIGEQSAFLDLESARLSRYPNINGNVNLGANFGRTVDPTSNEFINQAFYSNGFGLQSGVLLYNAGRIQKTIRQAETLINSSRENTKSIKYDIALQVANQYLAVLFAQENIKVAQEQLALTSIQEENLSLLIKSGVRAKNDILEFDAQKAQNQQAVLQATNQLLSAQLGLAQLLRLDQSTIEVSNDDNIVVTLDPDAVTLEQLVESTIASHPTLQASRHSIASAEIGEEIAETAKYPSITLGGNLGTTYSNRAVSLSGFDTEFVQTTVLINEIPTTLEIAQQVPIFEDQPYFNQLNDNISLGLGLGVNVPIWNNGTARINVERAKLNTINQSNNYEQALEAIKTQLQTALLDARRAKLQLQGAETATTAQTAAFQNTEKRYGAGAIGNLEYVTAQNILQQTQVNELIAKYDYFFRVIVLDFYLNGPDQFIK